MIPQLPTRASGTAAIRASTRPGLTFALLATAIYLANYLAIHRTPELGLAPLVDWPVAVDLLLVVPLLYLVFNRPIRSVHWGKALALASFGVVVGSWMLPAESKSIWLLLEPARFLVIGVVLMAQMVLIGLIARDVLAPQLQSPPEEILHAALARWVKPGIALELLKLEGRMWLYALFRRSRAQSFGGECFYGRTQSGNESNQLGFLMLVAAEIPVMHLLLWFVYPTLALVISVLSVYGLVFLYAEYRATQSRPISMLGDRLQIRYGLVGDLAIDYAQIAQARPCSQTPRRRRGQLRFVGMGEANVVIRLKRGAELATLMGQMAVEEIYLGVDQPGRFIERVNDLQGLQSANGGENALA